MTAAWLSELGWKSILLSALAFIILALVRRRSAAEKSLAGDAALLVIALLPLTAAFLPRIEIVTPSVVEAAMGSLGSAPPDAANPGATSFEIPASSNELKWGDVVVWIYLVPAVALLAGLLVSIVRLHGIYRRATVVEDSRWLTGLAAAQNRIGVKHGTALLISPEVNSPISWGVVRPVIMIDQGALASSAHAEAIIAHELAHVHRLDWPKLVLARLAVALFWFNPLVWFLARRCHQLREEAADDAVLRSQIAQADYAELLVTAVRHANAGPFLAANGVAPSASSIAQRVRHVLDTSRPRRAARLTWTGASFALAIAANAALAAAEPVIAARWSVDADAGERAALELADLSSPHARTLGAAIVAHDWEARRVSGRTTFNEPLAIAPLVDAMSDDDATVRRIAVWGLAEMRPAPALVAPAVSRLLKDPAAGVRQEAASAIGEFGKLEFSEALQERLLGDPAPKVRMAAAHALGDLQDPQSRSALEKAMEDQDRQVRTEARWARRQVLEAERLMNR